jgi:hypothetical protein
MAQKVIFIAFFLTVFDLVLLSQNSIVYSAKCREFWRIRKYQCAQLILKSDSTYSYKEMAGDLCLIVEYGNYFWNCDTLYLNTKEFGIIKYIKQDNVLLLQNNENLNSLILKLKENVP